jgi:hypothetical protein
MLKYESYAAVARADWRAQNKAKGGYYEVEELLLSKRASAADI